MTDSPIRADILEGLKVLRGMDVDELIGAERFGSTGNFGEVRPELENLKEVATQALSTPHLRFPDAMCRVIDNPLSKMTSILERMLMTETTLEPREKKAFFNEVRAHEHTILSHVLPYLNFRVTSRMAGSKLGELTSDAQNALDKAVSLSAKAEREIDEKLINLRTKSGELGAADYAKIFQNKAGRDSNAAKAWLTATVATLALMIVYIFLGLHTSVLDWSQTAEEAVSPEDSSISEETRRPSAGNAESIQRAALTVTLISVMYFGLVFCGRTYRANMHNSELNTHRANALSTFKIFADAAEGDTQTRNAVLMQTTRAIFDQQSTGYLVSDKVDARGSSQIVEIVKSLDRKP